MRTYPIPSLLLQISEWVIANITWESGVGACGNADALTRCSCWQFQPLFRGDKKQYPDIQHCPVLKLSFLNYSYDI
jgi:hypothetical protein